MNYPVRFVLFGGALLALCFTAKVAASASAVYRQ
jgi:hypothetical protein